MKAVGKYLICELVTEEVKTSSGLLLSGEDTKGFRYMKAKVITAGTEVTAIKENDIIYFDKGHSFNMLIKDKQYTITSERDVVVVED